MPTNYELAKNVLKGKVYCAGWGLYGVDNIVGDRVKTLFSKGHFHINICTDYCYFDVVGLSGDDFAHLKMWWNAISKLVNSVPPDESDDDEDEDEDDDGIHVFIDGYDTYISKEQVDKFDEEAERSFLNWEREEEELRRQKEERRRQEEELRHKKDEEEKKALTEWAESRGLDGLSLDEIRFKKNEEDYVNRTIKSNPFYCILAKHARECGFEVRVVRISDL